MSAFNIAYSRGTRRGRVRSSTRGIASSYHARFELLEPRRLLAANTPITTDADVQQQPTITVDPQNPQRLAIAYLDYSLLSTGYGGIGVSSSSDAGQTWSRSSVPLPAGFDQGAGHPIARFDDQGRLFVTFMAATFADPKPPIADPSFDPVTGAPYFDTVFNGSNGVFVARSDDAGLTWAPPVSVTSHVYDGSTKVPYEKKPDFAIDTYATLPNGLPNPNYGNIYVIWARYYPEGQFPGEPSSTGGSALQIAVSSDGGATFAFREGPTDPGHPEPISVIRDILYTGTGAPEGLGGASWPHVAVGPEGDVYVGFYDYGGFAVTHSTDAARSFDQPNYDANAYRYVFARPENNIAAPDAPQAAGVDGKFRTQVVRNVLPDPNRPGVVYAMEVVDNYDSVGNLRDSSDIIFTRSSDYGMSWNAPVHLNPGINAAVLNDDNLGRRSKGLDTDVAARQFYGRMAIDAAGNLAAIWYDTRRDPGNRLIEVFGTVSTNGGDTFSPNFRVSDASFDPDAGRFTDALGNDNYHLGDFIGLALNDQGTAYAAWTDTRRGSQDISFTPFSITSPPPAGNDRFEPNDATNAPTDLGDVIQRQLPKLSIGPGDVDVFRFQSPATGTIDIAAITEQTGGAITCELLDETGTAVLATGDRITLPGVANQQYLLRVTSSSNAAVGYSLKLQALTDDLGTVVYRQVAGTIAGDEQSYYLLTAAAAGSLRVDLTPGSGVIDDLTVEILDSKTLTALNSATATQTPAAASVRVTPGQQFLVRVTTPAGSTGGDYQLNLTNLDGYSTPGGTSAVFPAGNGPAQVATADFNHDGNSDLAVSNVLSDTVSILLGNGDGSFQSPRQFAIGAFATTIEATISVLHNGRGLAVADFDRDGNDDLVVTNKDSADVSVLLGHGDGTFAPQRRVDATSKPWSVDVGDLNVDGIPDLAVIDDYIDRTLTIGLLFGRGDGTFRHQTLVPTTSSGAAGVAKIKVADVNLDGRPDLVYAGGDDMSTHVLLNQEDGTFTESASFDGGAPGMAVADLNNDSIPDVVNASIYTNAVSFALGNGDGTFVSGGSFFGGQSPVSVDVADVASVDPGDGETVILGVPDGVPDILSVGSGAPQTAFQGPPQILVSAGLLADDGSVSYTPPVEVGTGVQLISLVATDVNNDGLKDIAFVDIAGVSVFSSRDLTTTPNTTAVTARDLGTVVHVLEPTLTIVPGFDDAWYSMTVPTEAARGSRDEVIDIAGLFKHEGEAGLQLEVIDESGNVLGSGERIRVVAAQGQQLLLHVFGKTGTGGTRGNGAYTLDVTVLPQVIAAEAQPLLPGVGSDLSGPTASIALTFQGERLDPESAQDPANYSVTWLGRDGMFGTRDDRLINLPTTPGVQHIVYNASANIDVTTGRIYPTAVRQTVTLLFAGALPTGSYRIDVSPAVVAARYDESESELLGEVGHSVVSVNTGITDGGTITADALVSRSRSLRDFSTFETGTQFLSQLHADLGVLLDREIGARGDVPTITDDLLAQILARLRGGLAATGLTSTPIVAIFLDPVSISLADPGGERLSYDLGSGDLVSGISNAFVSVASNVELVIVPQELGTFSLDISDVPETARGGAVLLGDGLRDVEMISFTQAMRTGQRSFEFGLDSADTPTPAAPILLTSSSRVLGNSESLWAEGRADLMPGTAQAASPPAVSVRPAQAGSVSGAANPNTLSSPSGVVRAKQVPGGTSSTRGAKTRGPGKTVSDVVDTWLDYFNQFLGRKPRNDEKRNPADDLRRPDAPEDEAQPTPTQSQDQRDAKQAASDVPSEAGEADKFDVQPAADVEPSVTEPAAVDVLAPAAFIVAGPSAIRRKRFARPHPRIRRRST